MFSVYLFPLFINLIIFGLSGLDVAHLGGEGLVYVGELFSGSATNSAGMRIGPRITVLDSNGNVLARLGEQRIGSEAGRFYAPHDISVDSLGDIYVAECPRSETQSQRYAGLVDHSQELRSVQKLVRVS